MAKSSTKMLILSNGQLSKLPPLFRENYAYYFLAEKLRKFLEKYCFQNGVSHQKNGIIIISEKALPGDIDHYLNHLKGKVEQTSCQNLIDLLFELIGYTSKKNTAPYKALDHIIVERLKGSHQYVSGSTDGETLQKLLKWGVVRDFWLRARSCTHLAGSTPKEHVGLKLLDLISVCSGYFNFSDYLDKEFGEDYDPEKDEILKSLIESKQEIKATPKSNFLKVLKERGYLGLKSIKSVKNSRSNFGKIIYHKNVPHFFLFTVFAISGIYLNYNRSREALINVNITTRYISFETAQNISLRSQDQNLINSYGQFTVRNAVYSLDYPFSDTLPSVVKIKQQNDKPVGIEYINLPKSTRVSMEAPAKNDFYLALSGIEGLFGFIDLKQSIVFSPNGLDSVIFDFEPKGTGINFQSNGNDLIEGSFINVADFKWPPIYITSVNFGVQKTDQITYGIESAQIDLLQQNKAVNLSPEDLLSLTFEVPVKLLIEYKNGLISIQFEGKVNSLYAGPEIFGKGKKNNLMPTLSEEYFGLSGKSYLVILIIFTVLLMLVFGKRRSI